MRDQLKKAKRIVIKLGTSTVVDDGKFNFPIIKNLAKQISKPDKQFIIVSSGAIGLANSHMNWEKSDDLVMNQCSASVGQNLLMSSYSKCFDKVAQLLLTYNDIADKKRRQTATDMIQKLMELNIIPIINENDSVSTEEITFGDNDILSAHVANMINADLLILLSDVDGLYKDMESKEVLDLVDNIDSEIQACSINKTSELGKGGMCSKLMSAKLASNTNTLTIIANGREEKIIKRILDGENIGTLFDLK